MLIPDPLQERKAFGNVFKIWFARNNWPQDVPHKLSQFIATGGPWNSQISTCMAAKLDPKVGFFLACGAFNEVVASQKFPGVANARLLTMLRKALPLRGDDGEVFNATNFFDLYTGRIAVPLDYQLPLIPELDDEGAKEISQQLRDQFFQISKAQMLSPVQAWASLTKTLFLPEEQRDRFKEILCGWGDFTAQELAALPSNEAHTPYSVSASLTSWGRSFPDES